MANEFKVKKGLIVDGSNTVVDIQGTVGQLFSVTDSLTGDLFSVSDVSGIPIFNVNSSGLSTFDGDVTITGGDSVAPQINMLHDGANPGTNEELGVVQFQVDYDGTHENWGKIRLDTNSSSVRTNMEFYVKSTSGAEQVALTLEGQPSAVPNAIFAGDVTVEGSISMNQSSTQVDMTGNTSGNFTIDNNTGNIAFQANGSTVQSMTITSSLITLNEIAQLNFATTINDDLTLNNSSPEIYFKTGASHYNWMIAAQENIDTVLEFTPANAVGASGTHNTPALSLYANRNANFAGHVKIASSKYLEFSAMGKLINLEVSSWGTGAQEHNLLYSGWSSSTGDYLSLKVAGNSTSNHGNLIIGDNGLWFGRMDTEDTAQATDSATNPNGASNYFRVDNSGNATFAGDITGAEDFKATGNNMKLFAGGTHVINIDLNKNFYPQTHNDTDIGFSDTLAFRHAFFSGTGKFSNVNASSYQLNGTYIVDSTRNLVNINNITASQLTIDDYIYHASDSDTYIYFTDDKQTFRTGGDDRFIIDNNGSTFSGHVKLFNTDEQIPNQNLLDIGSIKIAGRDDIYANATKTTYGDYVAKYVNDGTGGTTIRIYVDDNVLVDNEPYMVSVYYENLIGNLTLDWCDTGITGTNNVTGTSSSPKSGRVFGYGTRSTYNSTYRFVDINLSDGSGNEVTLHSPKVEAGKVVTDFVATERTDMTSNSKHLKDLKVTRSATFEQGVDINFGGSDRLSITGDVDVQGSTDFAIPQGRKLKFDTSGGHTYMSEETDSNLKVYVAATEVANFTNDNINTTKPLKLTRTPGANNTNPTLAFGDGNTGFYERSDNDLRVTVGGVNYWEFSANCMGNVSEGKAHFNSETATATNPSVIPWRNDSDTGIGRASANNLSLIAGGTETLRLGSNLATFNVGNSGATVFDVQGSNGQLFSVTDSLTGDLFSVSDVSGVPILNVNSSGAVDVDGTLNVKSDITMDNSGSGDTTLSISTTTGGDPTVVFNSDAANRNGLIKYQDNGTNVGRIQYVHNGDKLQFQAGSATGYALELTNTTAKIDANLYLENVDTNTSSETTVLVLNGSTLEVEKRELGSLAFSGLADSASGNRWGVNAFVASDGVMEVGRYIDFHTSDGSTSDFAHRLTVTGSTLYFSSGISGSSATFSSTVNMNATARFNFSANSHGSQFEAASTALQTFRCDSDRFRIYMGSERFTVTDGGRVGINDSTPDYTLDVNGSVSNISIYASHDVAAYSDARVKTDVETIPNALDKVNKLRGVTFKRTDEGSTDKRMMGVIAQEVLDVIPEVVNQRESDGHYSVSYGNMVGVLIEAVKELKAEVEELKKQIK